MEDEYDEVENYTGGKDEVIDAAPETGTIALEEDDEEWVEEIEDGEIQPMEIIDIIVNNEDRISCNMISLHELTEACGCRIAEIERTGETYLEDLYGLDNSIDIARMEITNGLSPLMTYRYMGDKIDKAKNILYRYYELWSVNELIKPISLM